MEIYDTVISYTLWIIHKIILKGEIEIYSVSDDDVYEVDFMNLVVDKADGLKVVDCDNHFCEFTQYIRLKSNRESSFFTI